MSNPESKATAVSEMNWKAICALYKTTFPEGKAKSKADKIAELQAHADQYAPRRTRSKALDQRTPRLIARYCRPTNMRTTYKLEIAIGLAKSRNPDQIVVTPADLVAAGLGQAWCKQPSSFLANRSYYHYRTLAKAGYTGQNVKGGLLVTPHGETWEETFDANQTALAEVSQLLLAAEGE
jgi:hypothetical protein